MNARTVVSIAVGLALFLIGILVWNSSFEEESIEIESSSEELTNNVAPESVASLQVSEYDQVAQVSDQYDYNREIIGFIPYLSNESLEAIGASDEVQKLEINSLVEESFHKIIDTVVFYGSLYESKDGAVTISAQIEEEIRDKLILDFYSRLETLLGSEKYDDFLRSKSIEYINTRMLNFGENEISITMRRIPPEQVMVSLATAVNAVEFNEFHSRNKSIRIDAFRDNFPDLADLLDANS